MQSVVYSLLHITGQRSPQPSSGADIRGADPVFRLNELALDLLAKLGVANKWCEKLKLLLQHDQDWEETELDLLLASHLPKLGEHLRKLRQQMS